MEILAVIGAIARLSAVVTALADAAPAAEETIKAGAKALTLIKKVVTQDPVQVPQSDIDEMNALAEQIEQDIIDSKD